MIIFHYDKNYIECDEEQIKLLTLTSSILAELNENNLNMIDVTRSMYSDSNIFYSAYYLFSSKKNLDSLLYNYFNLAKLIYLHYYECTNSIELEAMVDSMSECSIRELVLDF